MSLTFLPWVREGAATDLATGPEMLNRIRSSVQLQVNTTALTPVSVRLLGPGDVLGFDSALVVRTFPADGGIVEPNLFPFVELEEQSLPWLFTPAGADSTHPARLRPWIVLVVIRKQAGVRVVPDPRTRVDALIIEPPANAAAELPTLQESWAWAHVQVSGAVGPSDLGGVLAGEPERRVARLICPRRLDPRADYWACVVPAFAAGADAGLGRPVADDGPLTDAWAPTDQQVALPVYHRWQFTTDEAGDFESLARALTNEADVSGVGVRGLDLSDPGFDPPAGGPLTAEAGGALRAAGPEPAPGPDWFAAQLTALLAPSDPRSVRPPLYGAAQTGAASLQTKTGWLGELNTEVRHRAAAGLGVRVVREQQEQLMEAAWAQAGELDAVNRLLARQQLASALGETHMRRRLSPLADSNPDRLWQLTGPARVSIGDVRARAVAAGLPARALDPAFRRLARPRGPLARRLARDGEKLLEQPPGSAAEPQLKPETILAELDPSNALKTRVAFQLSAPAELALMNRADPLAAVVRSPRFPAPMSVELARLRPDALLPGAENLPEDAAVLLEPNRPFVAAFLAGLNHEMSRELLWREFPAELAATPFRVFWDRRGEAGPEVSPEQLADIPPIAGWDSGKALGEEVRATAEGELVLVVRGQLIRRYPRAVVSAVKAAAGAPRRLLADETVAGNLKRPLFKGRVAPDIAFFGFALSPATARGDDDGLGWYIVLQEQPSEPRFGLDVSEDTQFTDPPSQTPPGETEPRPALDSAALAWGHLVSREAFGHLTHAPVAAARPAGWWFPDRPDLAWTGGAADVAALTLQRPARVAIHAELLLPPGP